MSVSIPPKRKFEISYTYPNLDVPRSIGIGNPNRGLFQFSVTDSFDPTRPRRWEVMISGGTAFVGEGAKYFVHTTGQTNVVSSTVSFPGVSYIIVDAFGNTYLMVFSGARGVDCTIQRTAGASLTGDITVRSLLFAFDDAA
jgi:hypothetical protein